MQYKLRVTLDTDEIIVPYTGNDSIVAHAAFKAYCQEGNVFACDLYCKEPFVLSRWEPIRSFDHNREEEQ